MPVLHDIYMVSSEITRLYPRDRLFVVCVNDFFLFLQCEHSSVSRVSIDTVRSVHPRGYEPPPKEFISKIAAPFLNNEATVYTGRTAMI